MQGLLSARRFADDALHFARSLYDASKRGTLAIRVEGYQEGTTPIALVSEHRPAEQRQYQIPLTGGSAFRPLPAGNYSVSVHSPGYEPFGHLVEVSEGKLTAISAVLEKSTHAHEKPDVFQKYGLKKKGSLPKLTVASGTKHVLSAQSKEDNFYSLELTSIDQMKTVLGHPDLHWMGEHPHFGMKPANPPPKANDAAVLTSDARTALREYIYGNSRSVAEWKLALEGIIAASPVVLGLYGFGDVTVEAHSVLVVNAGGLFCDHLYVHATGSVVVRGGGPRVIYMHTYVAVDNISSGGGWPPPGHVRLDQVTTPKSNL